jgi:putative flippase GtrA
VVANLGLYGLVGGISAGLHALLLVFLPRVGVPLPVANLTGFLLASLWSYLAHAKVSFRQQTKGKVFPRRWLLLQLALNVILSLLLPAVFAPWAESPIATLILVFTPTAVNYGVWNVAANHVVRLQPRTNRKRPDCHADDLGLDESINDAIFDLADAGQLQGASLMVAGPAVAHAIAGLRSRPGLQVYLHLVLSEGPPISAPAEIPLLVNGQGYLNLGFGQLLLASLWPRRHTRTLARQLAIEIKAQILRFQSLLGAQAVHLDGHQHIHLVPLVWYELLKLEPGLRPIWLRTIREPWPTTISSASWMESVLSAGLLKWLILSLLSSALQPSLRRNQIATNSSFSGVLFTGRMAGSTLRAAFQYLSNQPPMPGSEGATAPLLLVHPAKRSASKPDGSKSEGTIDGRYNLSLGFYASPWRQKEYQSLAQLTEEVLVTDIASTEVAGEEKDVLEPSIDRIK